MKKRGRLPLLLTFFLAGCVVRPICPAFDREVPCEWHSAIPLNATNDPVEDAEWWKSLNDPLLNELMELAADQNFDVKIAEIQALQMQNGAAQENICETWITISADIAKNYIELRGFQQRLKILQKSVELKIHELQLSQQLLERQIISESDYKRAEAELAILKGEFPQIELQITQNLHHISFLIGYPPSEMFDCLSSESPLPELPAQFSIGAPDDLLLNRPDVRKAKKTLAAANGGCGIFRCSKLRAQEALYTYQKTYLEALTEVENALAAFTFEEERFQHLLVAYQLNLSRLSFVEELYQRESADQFELGKVKQSLFTAEENLLQSQVNLILNYIALHKTLGGCCLHTSEFEN